MTADEALARATAEMWSRHGESDYPLYEDFVPGQMAALRRLGYEVRRIGDHPLEQAAEAADGVNRGSLAAPSPSAAADALDVEALAALRRLFALLERLGRQADEPGPDHMVKITVELWRDSIQPDIRTVQAALAAYAAAKGGEG